MGISASTLALYHLTKTVRQKKMARLFFVLICLTFFCSGLALHCLVCSGKDGKCEENEKGTCTKCPDGSIGCFTGSCNMTDPFNITAEIKYCGGGQTLLDTAVEGE